MPEKFSEVKLSNGVVVQLVFNGDSWYAPLPVANNNEFYTIIPEPRGKSVKDGFKATQKNKAE